MQPALRDEAENAEHLRRRLQHVYWIGGGSGAGKSTIARRIADEYGMRVYATDEIMSDHARRMPSDQAPYLSKFAAMTMDERWVTRSPQEMLDTFHWFHGEGFQLIVEDLIHMPNDRPVIAEGFRLLPDLVKPLLAHPRHAVWLLPTPEFRRDVFDGRGGPAWGFLAKTGDPERALQNLLERDRMFTDRIKEQTQRLDLTIITVSSTITDEDAAQRLATTFGLSDQAKP
jgi:2-phosphoglycerate kinase